MTENKENYIKEIFEFEENKLILTNKVLAESLSVSPASASQMISKLIKEGWVEDDTKHLTLTEKARVLAKEIISKHRLWESFLLEYLDYDNSELHMDAEVLEHVTSPLLLDRLNQFLDYPKRCPHGGIIYLNNGDSARDMTLLDAEVDSKIFIRRFIDDPELINYMSSINVSINDEASVEAIDPLNENIYLKFSDTSIVLSFRVAQMIYINIKDSK